MWSSLRLKAADGFADGMRELVDVDLENHDSRRCCEWSSASASGELSNGTSRTEERIPEIKY